MACQGYSRVSVVKFRANQQPKLYHVHHDLSDSFVLLSPLPYCRQERQAGTHMVPCNDHGKVTSETKNNMPKSMKDFRTSLHSAF